MSIQDSVKEFLESSVIDFTFDFEQNNFQIYQELLELLNVNDNDDEDNINVKYTIKTILDKELKKLYTYQGMIDQVKILKALKLPDQRTPEWYAMRKNKLTASSFADALGKGHFNTRNQSLYDKIVDKPFVPNPITEWGVKYEEVATRFYEHLTGTSIYEFGMIPHPEYPAFGASPDGICDINSPPQYIGRMLEIKCPPKRKFTKTVPPHYWMQMQGQLEVCNLEDCDFLQVKLEEYDNYEEYKKDSQDKTGFTNEDLPKGYTITYLDEINKEKFKYLYCPLFSSDSEIELWKENQMKYLQENNLTIHEEKYWKITRYECTLVKRDREWWADNVENIYNYFKDLIYYKKDDNIKELEELINKEGPKKVYTVKETFNDFFLIDETENN